jgi:hypothetical protein
MGALACRTPEPRDAAAAIRHRRVWQGTCGRCNARNATSTCGPNLYNRCYLEEFPEKYHARMDVRRWGPGERIVFEPYT